MASAGTRHTGSASEAKAAPGTAPPAFPTPSGSWPACFALSCVSPSAVWVRLSRGGCPLRGQSLVFVPTAPTPARCPKAPAAGQERAWGWLETVQGGQSWGPGGELSLSSPRFARDDNCPRCQASCSVRGVRHLTQALCFYHEHPTKLTLLFLGTPWLPSWTQRSLPKRQRLPLPAWSSRLPPSIALLDSEPWVPSQFRYPKLV